jgi:predicted transcriptional regulator
MERVRIFELLLAFGGTSTSRQIVDYLNTSGTTAKRTMAEFKTIGIVNIETEPSEQGEPQKRMTLNNKFEWVLE